MEEEYLRYITEIEVHDLRRIMEEYGEDVWKFAYFLTKRKELADDISQDVFLKVYINIRSFRGESTLKTWLLKITRNTALSYLKRSFFRKSILMEYVPIKGTHPSAEETFFKERISDEIWDVVLKLPAKYREVLILGTYYQLSLNEIGSTLGISIGTVKSRLHRAKQKFATLMERRGENESLQR
ncbi:RNA polymerase sigma-70 factor, ECF subfamily [Paenibacillus sp. RU4T]|uniref:RNA polymerase sigma factor n=1 Tax=unclassified Paenibacillus TaxID=185978 RepID=UPI0009544BD1|nr:MULTISPECIES: RNA polymerase sigma factor [unclassified Paenibacillus]SIR50333.1 RNA polymerase sigma-70 factor, ECF subfamily [Paenibacillus sp. RU4X]SIR59390.1 RNA polymerase sigma-70 factor, ECF subfamily [Paenibacillus sp. RU4T]